MLKHIFLTAKGYAFSQISAAKKPRLFKKIHAKLIRHPLKKRNLTSFLYSTALFLTVPHAVIAQTMPTPRTASIQTDSSINASSRLMNGMDAAMQNSQTTTSTSTSTSTNFSSYATTLSAIKDTQNVAALSTAPLIKSESEVAKKANSNIKAPEVLPATAVSIPLSTAAPITSTPTSTSLTPAPTTPTLTRNESNLTSEHPLNSMNLSSINAASINTPSIDASISSTASTTATTATATPMLSNQVGALVEATVEKTQDSINALGKVIFHSNSNKKATPTAPVNKVNNGDTSNKTAGLNLLEKGLASWYGDYFHGRQTASGKIFNMFAFSAAHKQLPLGTRIAVLNTKNNKSIILEVNDRGPYKHNRVLDLSFAAAKALDVIKEGVANVEIYLIERAPKFKYQHLGSAK